MALASKHHSLASKQRQNLTYFRHECPQGLWNRPLTVKRVLTSLHLSTGAKGRACNHPVQVSIAHTKQVTWIQIFQHGTQYFVGDTGSIRALSKKPVQDNRLDGGPIPAFPQTYILEAT